MHRTILRPSPTPHPRAAKRTGPAPAPPGRASRTWGTHACREPFVRALAVLAVLGVLGAWVSPALAGPAPSATLRAVLVGGTANAPSALVGALPAPGLTSLGLAELAAVTGGVCTNCDDGGGGSGSGSGGGGGGDGSPLIVSYEWRAYSSTLRPPQKLDVSIAEEYSNMYGTTPKTWGFEATDDCAWRVASGGVGISAGFNISIGRTYVCSHNVKLSGTLDPGWRVKIYQADMRQATDLVAREYAIYDDGSSAWTGNIDSGTKLKTWNKFSAVDTDQP